MDCYTNSDAPRIDSAVVSRAIKSVASAILLLLATTGSVLAPANAADVTATSRAHFAHAKPTRLAMGRGQFDRIDMQPTGSIGSRPVTAHESFETAYVCSLSGAGQTTTCSLQRVGSRF